MSGARLRLRCLALTCAAALLLPVAGGAVTAPAQQRVPRAASPSCARCSTGDTGDVKKNTGKAYPTTPGHFESFSCSP